MSSSEATLANLRIAAQPALSLVCACMAFAIVAQSYDSVAQAQTSVTLSDANYFQAQAQSKGNGVARASFTDSKPEVSTRASTRRTISDRSVVASNWSFSDDAAKATPPAKVAPHPPTKTNFTDMLEQRSLKHRGPVTEKLTAQTLDGFPGNQTQPVSETLNTQTLNSQSLGTQPDAGFRVASKLLPQQFSSSQVNPSPQTFSQPQMQQQSNVKTGSRLIRSTLGDIQFVKAKQFLSQEPEFEDPKKFLADPKKVQKQFREPKLSQRRTQPRNTKTRTPSRQKKDVARVQRPIEGSIMNPVSDVRMPISPVPLGNIYQRDPSNLLSNDQRFQTTTAGDQLNYAQLTQNEFVPSSKAWLAPNFVHRPLYFEETQLERYGNRRNYQLIRSGLHFFGTLPVLPYKMGADLPTDCHYTYGTYRPGDCVPYDIYRRPLDKKGLISQAFWSSLIMLP